MVKLTCHFCVFIYFDSVNIYQSILTCFLIFSKALNYLKPYWLKGALKVFSPKKFRFLERKRNVFGSSTLYLAFLQLQQDYKQLYECSPLRKKLISLKSKFKSNFNKSFERFSNFYLYLLSSGLGKLIIYLFVNLK